MKKIIAATMILGTMNAFAGNYSVKFNKPLTLTGSALLNVQKVEDKLTEEGKWDSNRLSEQSQNCQFSIKIEGRDNAIENKGIGEHYYGSMALSCARSGLFGSAFKTNFSRVLLTGIRKCVVSETVIDNDYCNLEVLAFRKETDINMQNGDLISDKPKVRRYFAIHSYAAMDYINKQNLIPNGMNPDLIDSVQSFTLSIGRNGNEFFVPGSNANESFGGGRNIFLKFADSDLNRDAQLRNDIETDLKDLQQKMDVITADANPTESFKKNISPVVVKFSSTVQKLLGIISPVDFFNLEGQLKSFERNLVSSAKTFNPNITSRDSFKNTYSANATQLSVMMDYLTRQSDSVTDISNNTEDSSLEMKNGMDQAAYSTSIAKLLSQHPDTDDFSSFYKTNENKISFQQFKMFVTVMSRADTNNIDYYTNQIIEQFFFKNVTLASRKNVDELIALLVGRNKSDNESRILAYWNVLHP